MNRRFLIKGLLSSYILCQFNPKVVLSKSINHKQTNFSKVQDCINRGIVGWDFGVGMHNFQYHAFDTVNSHLYTLQHSTNDNKGGKVSRFDIKNIGKEQIAIDAQRYDNEIGHQMLSVENIGSEVKLWAAKGLQESYSIIRFNYTPDALASNIEEYVVFDPKIFGSFYITGNLSFDQKWVIVRGKSRDDSKYNGLNCIAIFNLKKLINNGPGHAWHLADYLWTYNFYENNPKNIEINPQSIFSDGKFIFLLFGPIDVNKPNLLRIYSFDGKLVFESSELKLGKNDALITSRGKANEMEGAQLVKLPSEDNLALTIGYVRGGPEYHKGIYVIYNFPKIISSN